MSIGVLVVDDQPLYRRAVRRVVEATPDFRVVGEAESGKLALAAAAELAPDIALVAVRMEGMDGIETSRRLRSAHPETVVVLMSVEGVLSLSAEVGFCGAAECVRKQDLRPRLLQRIWAVEKPSARA